MGVPALFRWLSKKYPKIIYPVVEEEEVKVPDENDEDVIIPVNTSHPNPNGTEFDNLYLDMNGIVHPCTHPEGKPAPETEEEMMVEIFAYTERVVSMVRPRKLLFMAIDGVAPRAKMNQQRSRRFRSAQEAKDKDDARKESVLMWEAMGKTLSDEEKNKTSWDSNAITPGTPFMDLLASSLRYWVARKINTDPGWKQMQVIISDASVPGEGEHKIMDFIRRQRTNTGHDPNTQHVIYGLDADLIMLSLATHEPHFRVLREDVFANDTSPTACRLCGQEGHYAAQCTGEKKEIEKKPASKKPFIFLDVAILREYLEVELNVQSAPFPFNLEQAIDDWVLLIFFVGNDFLPHLPSLEIREGAIDTLLEIWKTELSRMGGYLTNHGQIQLERAELILEGLAVREDQIFRRRREAEERQNENAKRRKIENDRRNADVGTGPSPAIALTASPTAPTGPPAHPSLPRRPDFAANADSIGFGAPQTEQSIQEAPTAAQALAGSNRDVVANRRAIRLANMSAAEMLKAELGGSLAPMPVKPDLALPAKPTEKTPDTVDSSTAAAPPEDSQMDLGSDEIEFPGLGNETADPTDDSITPSKEETNGVSTADHDMVAEEDLDAEGEIDPDAPAEGNLEVDNLLAGVKRKIEEAEEDDDPVLPDDDDDDAPPADTSFALKVNADGSVEQDDTVKLWEPGYKERYYRQKFGVELSDKKFRKELTKAYVEGLVWVLQYYYQGTPSWQWYYPYHFAPFAADFEDVGKMDIQFNKGQPFKPFEQLMGVFPAASRVHIPEVFHSLMTAEDSPIIDFYPSTFEIDMNGKKMVWQGVALLPFINEKRLLDAMAPRCEMLSEEEKRRNGAGHDIMFASDEHPVYPFFETLYGKRKNQEPVPLDVTLSKGISGKVLPNPDCLPGSTYYCPLTTQDLPDIRNDRSLSALYFFPEQLKPHRSVLLPGVKRPARQLSQFDIEKTRRGRGGGRGGSSNGPGRGSYGGNNMFHGANGSNSYGNDRGRGQSSYQATSYTSSYQRQPPPYQAPQGYGGYGAPRGGGYGGPTQYGGGRGGGPPRGGPPSYDPRGGSYGSSYGQGQGNSRGGYGGYGGYDAYGGGANGGGGRGGAGGGGYGGYGGYGQMPPTNGRGAPPYNPRGRGRGW